MVSDPERATAKTFRPRISPSVKLRPVGAKDFAGIVSKLTIGVGKGG